MGCCTSNVEKFSNHRNFNSVLPELDAVTSSYNGPYSINDPFTIFEGLTVNPLGLAFCQGNLKKLKTLKELCRADVKQMELMFTKQNISPFEILFKKGHLEVMKYYLPIFMLNCDVKLTENSLLQKPLLLQAVRHKHLHIIKYIHSYFIDVEPPPAFSVHAVDHDRSENSALIACKNQDLPMVKYLYEDCKVNFCVKNNKNQTPLILAGLASEDSELCYELVKYLIEKVGLSTTVDYEYLIEVFENPRVRNLIRQNFLELESSFVSETASRISEITGFGKKEEDMTISDMNFF